jgi:hypothetical protein
MQAILKKDRNSNIHNSLNCNSSASLLHPKKQLKNINSSHGRKSSESTKTKSEIQKVRFADEVQVAEISCRSSTDISKDSVQFKGHSIMSPATKVSSSNNDGDDDD